MGSGDGWLHPPTRVIDDSIPAATLGVSKHTGATPSWLTMMTPCQRVSLTLALLAAIGVVVGRGGLCQPSIIAAGA